MVGYKDYNVHKHHTKPLTQSKTDNHDLLTLRMVSSPDCIFLSPGLVNCLFHVHLSALEYWHIVLF